MNIHPTAAVAAGAEIAEDVVVGPFAVIDAKVRIRAGCRIEGHAQLLNSVELGESCEVGHGAIIGGNPQDLGFDRATPSGIVIGARNVFREHVTVNRSSVEGGATRIGDGNYLMASSHAGHDVVIGDNNVIANACMLGGHVTVGNSTFLGGGGGFHQFVRIGDLCMVKGLTAISQDVPPFVIMSGSNDVRGLNSIGLRRAGYDKETRDSIKLAFTIVMREGHNIDAALEKAAANALKPEAEAFVEFFRTPSRKGICRV